MAPPDAGGTGRLGHGRGYCRSCGFATWSRCPTSPGSARGREDPPVKADLTSVGIDLGSKLSSWKTRLSRKSSGSSSARRQRIGPSWSPPNPRARPIRRRALRQGWHSSSGFASGHAELVKGRRMGVFSSVENVRKLLDENELTSVIDRSEPPARPGWPELRRPDRHLTRSLAVGRHPTEAKRVPGPPRAGVGGSRRNTGRVRSPPDRSPLSVSSATATGAGRR